MTAAYRIAEKKCATCMAKNNSSTTANTCLRWGTWGKSPTTAK